jgi:hypothetical protein
MLYSGTPVTTADMIDLLAGTRKAFTRREGSVSPVTGPSLHQQDGCTVAGVTTRRCGGWAVSTVAGEASQAANSRPPRLRSI